MVKVQLNEIHSFANTGSEPLELMVVGVSRDSTKRIDEIAMPFPAARNGGLTATQPGR